ncbi:right-handed parallel beta-helix repeat-containing protein [Tamlana sp. s12]|uniref:right-handed parallel beta-helix repeat-containing protein n=1 Tax=Tamlana sp. s12 TaxID=1630406 RepID=UPI0007FD8DCF|nr:right-handed parallel beta-helix repeat-containing protein [Tamlana sp. s12]OBQ54109.1 hypothetical protein VQ01_11675 [Tamlana sp. s12]QQY81380.1 right-handed parallel beta-helix repeat-containing protein [Tamlana sp. s12]
MKKNLNQMMLVLFLMLVTSSCNNEELFVEDISEENIENESDEDSNEENIADATSPCDFLLGNIEANSKIIIDCLIDLEGKEISLPPNVSIVHEGGDITNGKLNFTGGGNISSELLNENLGVSGESVELNKNEFNFKPERWGIVEGKVSDEVANKNSDIIRETILLAKEYGVDTFVIDKMDAYFGPNGDSYNEAIRLPSNFHLKMTENTNLRMQPNGLERNALLFCWKEDKVTISGGKLWGDRYTHDYTAVNGSHEWGTLIRFKGVHNGIVDNVEMHEATGDGFVVLGVSDRNPDGSLKPGKIESFNVTVRGCLIKDNRRNNVTIGDGTNIFIENNTIIGAGGGNSGTKSDGTSPQAGIDVEAREKKAPDGNSIYEWQKTDNLHIRHNVFEDNYAGDIGLLSGENTFIYENTFRSQRAIGTAGSFNCKIYNNIFERPDGIISDSKAINLEPRYWDNGTQRVTDFEVYNNTIIGYQYAILAGGKNHTFTNNTITNCKAGITLLNSEDLKFDNNVISSNIETSTGYVTFSVETNIKNASIKNGSTSVKGRDLYFSYKNNNQAGSITIDNVTFNGEISFRSVQGVTLKNSSFANISITDCSPVLINNN